MLIDTIASIEAFLAVIPTDKPYIGSENATPKLAERGYAISEVNKTIYPKDSKSVIVKITTAGGVVGWGETYGLCAAGAIGAICEDVILPFIHGKDPFDVRCIGEDLYDLMRVRNYTGYYSDALAAIDIALWDICGKLRRASLSKLLGGVRHTAIPAYVSAVRGESDADKINYAKTFREKGFSAFKVHTLGSQDVVRDIALLREALGPDVSLMLDMHWQYTSAEAADLIRQLSPYNISFAEAPCEPEDMAGLLRVSQSVTTPIAAGEEWRTLYQAAQRLSNGSVSIAQPEIARLGVSQFMQIVALTTAFHARLIPHATIGCGIFHAASLQASSTAACLSLHEYHPAIFETYASLLESDMRIEEGSFMIPTGDGLGVTPSAKLLNYMTPL